MKQTAVQWFYCRYMTEMEQNGEIEYDLLNKLFEQAKEMEKEQITAAYRVGKVEANLPPEKPTTAEQYYNETFKSE